MVELFNGDCISLMAQIPDNSVDLVLCDLPYGVTNNYWDTPIDLGLFWEQFKRIRKSKNTACIHFCTTSFGYTLIKSWEKGFHQDLVWSKRNVTGALNAGRKPMRNHEMIYFFAEKNPKYNRDKYHKKISCKTPECSEEDKDVKPKRGFCEPRFTYAKNKIIRNRYEPTCPKSIIQTDKIPGKKPKHNTEKPLDVLEWLLKYYSDEGDVILDPTMGSGSTGEACMRLDRKFIGIEKDPEIFKIAEERLAE